MGLHAGDGDAIFVSVAAYCDPLLDFTLKSAWANAQHPARVFFGVIDQAQAGRHWRSSSTWARAQVRSLALDAREARGPCWARALAMTLYRGEDWFLQVDSHTWFEPGWDRRLIAAASRGVREQPRSIFSCYPNPFVLAGGQPRAETVSRRVLAHVVSDGAEFAADHPTLRFEGVPVESDRPVPAIHLAAGALFAPGRIVAELPYDPQLYFHGEEQSLALRAYTHGWDLWHPPGMPLYHLYTPAGTAPRPLHWDADHDAQRAERSAALDAAARRRLAALLWEGADFGVHGLGTRRSLADYARYAGIDYAARTIAPLARKARFGY